jgi:hypothetical protein
MSSAIVSCGGDDEGKLQEDVQKSSKIVKNEKDPEHP